MGYSYRNNGNIQDFWPDDMELEFYIAHGTSLAVIIAAAKNQWGEDVYFEDIAIIPEHIHTECLTYDSYCAADYTQFLRIELKK